MDRPHLFRVVTVASIQGRKVGLERPMFVLAFSAFDVWQAIAARASVPPDKMVSPTSVVLELLRGTDPAKVKGDVYQLRHGGRASDLLPWVAPPKKKTPPTEAAGAAPVRSPAR